MALDSTNGLAVKEVVCDLTTAEFSTRSAFEGKPEAVLRFFGRDHEDGSSKRVWDAAARDRLLRFLAEELSAFEAAVRASGVDAWDQASPRWDAKRIRRLHPGAVDVAVIREGAGGVLA